MLDPTTAAMIPFIIFMMLFSFALPIAVYVLSALGLYRMAKACNLKSPYLAWIPIADLYIIGSIAEIGASRGGKKSMPFRKILPGLNIAVIAVAIVMVVCLFAFAFSTMSTSDHTEDVNDNVEFVSHTDYDLEIDLDADLDYDIGTEDDLYSDDEYYDEYDAEAEALAVTMMLIVIPFYFILIALAVLVSVFQYIALWHIFKLFDETNAVLYLLLSIFVSVALPIIYLILSRKTPALPMAEAPASPVPVAVPATVEAPAVEAPTEEAPVTEAPQESSSDENQ